MRLLRSIAILTALAYSFNLYAQSKSDTVITLYDWNWKPIKSGVPTYAGIAWPENGKWHKQDMYFTEYKLQMDGYYLDKDFKIKDGIFTWYHRNGMMTDSCLFVKNKKQGRELTWDDKGNLRSVQNWENGIPVDTARWLDENGNVYAWRITDSAGNGLYRSFSDDRKITRAEGRYFAGQQSGKWIYRDANGVLSMEAMFDKDSVVSSVCYNEKGVRENKGDCILEKTAQFKGGIEGWRRYLERNLNYPADAQKRQVEGIVKVRFIIDKEGNVSNAEVIESPDETLSAEAKRIITHSGKWEPAIQYNRKVNYYHIQGITFKLE